MDNQIQGEVIGSAIFAPLPTERTSLQEALHEVMHAALRDSGIANDGFVVASCDCDRVGIRRRREKRYCVDAIERRSCIRTGRAARALRPLQHPAESADARMCRFSGGSAKVMERIIGNALLLPKVRKAN